MKKILCLVFLCLSTQSYSQEKSGPFGLEAGMTKEQILKIVGDGAIKASDGDVLLLTAVPEAHPDFETYTLLICPEKGLLKILAMSKSVNTNVRGTELKSAYDSLKASLATTYGKPNHALDMVSNGSIWIYPDDWMAGLAKSERALASSWMDIPLPNKLRFIRLDAAAKSKTVGYLNLTYEFEGLEAYMKSKEAKEPKPKK